MKRDDMDKVREWVVMHITIPIQAIWLMKRTYHDEIEQLGAEYAKR